MKRNNLVKRHAYYNNQFFARWAKMYDFEKYFMFPLRRKTARFLNLTPHKKILDVATGTGSQAYELAKLGHEVIGIDLSREMLEQAKEKLDSSLKLSFIHANATNLPFKDNAFAASSISLGLHDMPYDVDLLTLKEMKRVTRKNGEILIVDYMEPKKHWMAKLTYPLIRLYETHNYVPFIERGLDAILKEVDLKIARYTDFLGLFQIAVVRNKK